MLYTELAPGLAIRPAVAADRETVLAFCASTWHWGDYIPAVWDDWLADRDADLLVATLDGRPVGLARSAYLNEREAWFEGLRVDPRHRRHGIARLLTETCLGAARRRGARVARLAVWRWNEPSLSLVRSFGFVECDRIRSLAFDAAALDASGENAGNKAAADGRLRLAAIAEVPALMELAARHARQAGRVSETGRPALGFLWDYRWQELNPDLLADMARRGQLWLHDGGDGPAGFGLLADWEEETGLFFLSGSPDAAVALGRMALRYAADHGRGRFSLDMPAWLAGDADLRAAIGTPAPAAGGELEGVTEYWIMEKWL